MDARDIERFRTLFLSDPSAFVEGAQGLCKKAGLRETWDAVKLPLLLGLLTYGGAKAGTAWGRYAQRTGNPNGPVKGPIMKLLEAALPDGERVLYKGTPQYDAHVANKALEGYYDA